MATNRNTFAITILVFLIVIISACGTKQNAEREIKYLPVKLAGSDLWSLVDVRTGEIIIKDEFKNEPSVVWDDIFYVKNNEDKYDYYTIESVNKPINSESYVAVTDFNEKGYALVTKAGCPISIIDKQCKEVAVLSEDFKDCFALSDNMDYLFFENWEGKNGIANSKGEIIVPAKYDDVSSISTDGYVCMGIKNDNDTYTYTLMDFSGKELFSFSSEEYKNHAYVSDGLIAVEKENDVILLNLKGERVLNVGKSKEYKLYQMVPYKGNVIFSDGVLFGMKDLEGEVVIRAKYDDLHFAGDYLVAKKNDKVGLINRKDEVLIPFDYSDIDIIAKDRFLVESDKLSAIVDCANKDVGINNFSDSNTYSHSYLLSNFFNAIKVAENFCKFFSNKDCCNYADGVKLSDLKTFADHVSEFPYTFSEKTEISTRDIYDYTNPIKVLHFDRFLSHKKYTYFYGYRFSDGIEVSKDARLTYVELNQKISSFPENVNQQFVDAMAIVLPEKGFVDNGKGIFVSDQGTAVSAGYNDDVIVLNYYFKESGASLAPRKPRKPKEE
ncbi:MAG: WG repeat-containing protein [Bacteroidales bacterium]|nr:WG repeat-containing protein [Bacteroidales bacterium]